jgi:PGF-pre-PGF domain-containing protein
MNKEFVPIRTGLGVLLLCLVFIVVPAMANLANTPWAKVLHDSNNTGLSPHLGAQTNTLKWSYPTGDVIMRISPVIGSDGTIYIGSNDGNLYALDPNGTLKWKYATGAIDLSSAAVGSDGTIYVGTNGAGFYALKPDGSQKWHYNAGGDIASPAIGSDGTIYFGSDNQNLYALNPDGTWKWTFTAGYFYDSPAIGGDGTLYIGSSDQNLYALDPADGSVKWSYGTGGPIMGSPAIDKDGTIYTGSGDNNVYAIHPNGHWKWTYSTGGAIEMATPAIGPDGTVYIGSSDTNLYALDPTDGIKKWSFATGDMIYESAAVGPDGTIYVGSFDCNIYALDPTSGNPKWYYTTGSVIWGSPAIGSDGAVYIGSLDNSLYAFAGPVDFTADMTSGVEPLAVQFTDASTVTSTSWSWDFGDGTISTEQKPTHTYTSSGSYTVNLTITHSYGTNYIPKSGYVTVYSQPVAGFAADISSGLPPLSVQFTDQSTGLPTSWSWDFGDGTTSTDQNPVHVYSLAGSYTVTLTSTNPAGSNTTSKTGYIMVAGTAPIITFTASPRVGIAPLAVQFNDTSTLSPTLWSWDFGDGTTSTEKNPAHTYNSVGVYNVKLSATNGIGTNSSTRAGFIAVLTPQSLSNYRNINIYVANDEGVKYDVPYGVSKVFTYNYVPNTYFVLFEQDDGGLTPMHISSASNAGSSADITRTTSQSGSFWVTFSGGQTSMPDDILMVAVNGTIPDDFKLHIRSSGVEFDPGTPGTDNQFPGTTIPTGVTFVDGAVDQTFTKSDFIYGSQSWKPSSSAGYPIYSGEDQTDPINQYQIMFIDLRTGAFQNTTLPNNGMIKVEYSFTNLSSTAVFNTYGWYETSYHGTGVIMTNAVDSSGYMVTKSTTAPVAAFSSDVTIGEVPLTANFLDTSTNTPTSWAWDFGDGTTATAQDPTHQYTTAGSYTVKLTATNSYGSNTVTKKGYITVTTPLPTNDKIFISVANTAGAKYNIFGNNTYYSSFNGATSGLNALHISTDPSTKGEATVTGNQSGTFYATESGGMKHKDDIILMVAVNGTIPDDFKLNLDADGYTWTPFSTNETAPPVSAVTYQPSSLSATFTKSDFKYGPQIWKPSGNASYPIYAGQDMSDTGNTFQLMFVDLNSGVLLPNSALQNQGSLRINYSFQNLNTAAAFGVYGYCNYSNNGKDMMAWTNSLSSGNPPINGYMVTGSSVSTGGAPVAGFTAGSISGTTATPIQFTDTSTNTPTSWSWDFGDGTTATTQNPAHQYTTAGTYTVKLTATNSVGSDTATKTNYITVTAYGSTVASFTATPLTGNAPLAVQFTDTSTNTPTSWLWDFGDATNSTSRNPSHTYNAAGTYSVNLTATNAVNSNSHLASGLITVGTVGGVLPDYTGIYVRAANKEGVRYNANDNNTYYINNLGSGGLNAVHISTDPAVSAGQVFVSGNQSGTFYLTDTSGGGYQDEGVIMLAVNGTLPADFAVHIKTSGYTWTPSESSTAPASGSYTYQPAALDETFTGSDFLYGPQDWKPTGGTANYPIFSGENMTDTVNPYRLMFIDTRAGMFGTHYADYTSLTDNGAVKVEYTFTHLPGYAAFNVYGWKNSSSNGQGMGWTNALTGAGSSGYSVIGTYTGTSSTGSTGASGIGISSGTSITSVSAGRSSSLTTTMDGAKTGETATVTFNQGTSGSEPLGIASVGIVPHQPLGSTQMIVHDVRAADVLTVPDKPVAGIEEIELIGTNPAAIDHGVITFSLSGAWLTANELTPGDIVMLRNHGGQWVELPTTFDHQDGTTYYFTATTPGFSYFAVAGRSGSAVTAAPNVTATSARPGALSSAASVTTATTKRPVTPKSTTLVPVAMQDAPASAKPAAATGMSPLIITAAAIAGIALIATSGFIVRRWWIRRQNPALFRGVPFFRFGRM